MAARSLGWVEQGLVPDRAVRHGIRRLLRERLESLPLDDPEAAAAAENEFVARMDASPIALVPHLANEQHYEVPPAFFEQVLGGHRKYSCAHWPAGVSDLDEAERSALALTCERAEIREGMRVLELGCGWGSLTLWLAEHYPSCEIVAVSNSTAQAHHIAGRAARRGLDRVQVITADMNDFEAPGRFDRVISIEMFEHMRNYRRLFERVASWLTPGGLFFMHVFCHRALSYEFVDEGPGDWMSRHFFTGGMMPADDLPLRFQDHLSLLRRWRWSGRHYEATANAWLTRMDRRRESVWPILEGCYGAGNTSLWWNRWRIFFMACAETFGYDEGRQWWVSHYLFAHPGATANGPRRRSVHRAGRA